MASFLDELKVVDPAPGEIWEGIPDKRRQTQRRRVVVEAVRTGYWVAWRWEDSGAVIHSSLANWRRWARKMVGQVTAAHAAGGMKHE